MFLKKIFFVLLLSCIFGFSATAQFVRLNNDISYYHETNLNFDTVRHYTIKPYKKDYYKDVHFQNIFSENKLFNDNLLEIKNKNTDFILNPIITSSCYKDFSDKRFFSDLRAGISVQSSYKNKLFISSDIFYSATEFPSYFDDLINKFGIIPHFGKYIKRTNSKIEFYSWTGDITYQANKYISLSGGRGKFFLGNGYRSLFLSDNSNAFPYVKAEVNIWKIKYLWMFTKLSDVNLSSGVNTNILYDKAAFLHYFSLNITKRINFDFFETVITNPYDSNGRHISYDAVYFNPVIFYRPTEFYKGTSDNSLMGIALNARLFKSTFLYSQFILDDIIISSLRDKSGWWGNKFGMQAGIKVYNVLNINGLFVRGEINAVRPYTYSHGEAYVNQGIANLNYGNFRQELAHPFGANFAEGIALIRYVKGRFSAKVKIISAKKGEDINDTVSYGGNIYKSYRLRPDDYGIKFLQGEISNIRIFDLGFSYLINPEYGLLFNVGFYYRKKTNQFTEEQSQIIYFGLSTDIFNSSF